MPMPRIAVVSPFLDKRHGTERCVAEQVERLARDYEVHIYSNRVEDIDLRRIVWHRIPALPGPHLLAYAWWLFANHVRRWWDKRFGGLPCDLTYTPGINCFNADVISVHIVFREFYRQARYDLRFAGHPIRFWPRLLHRRIYYYLLMALERPVYGGKSVLLTGVSAKVARDLQAYRRFECPPAVIVYGSDAQRFNPETRRKLRAQARRALNVQHDLCLLLVGNDWKKKGLPCVLEALGRIAQLSVQLLVVGSDNVGPYQSTLARLHLQDRVAFFPLRPDVEFYYAAADLYVGPSLEDAFAMPPLEAMACGVPSIVSSQAGVSEIITSGVDGFVISDPRGSGKLADLIALLYDQQALRQKMGEAAARTAVQYTWDSNAAQLRTLFEQVLARRHGQEVFAKESAK